MTQRLPPFKTDHDFGDENGGHLPIDRFNEKQIQPPPTDEEIDRRLDIFRSRASP
ncbi:MAG TPA: hypothetical protein VJI74_00065 [Candidatus Paceibacterota bacterium]